MANLNHPSVKTFRDEQLVLTFRPRMYTDLGEAMCVATAKRLLDEMNLVRIEVDPNLIVAVFMVLDDESLDEETERLKDLVRPFTIGDVDVSRRPWV